MESIQLTNKSEAYTPTSAIHTEIQLFTNGDMNLTKSFNNSIRQQSLHNNFMKNLMTATYPTIATKTS